MEHLLEEDAPQASTHKEQSLSPFLAISDQEKIRRSMSPLLLSSMIKKLTSSKQMLKDSNERLQQIFDNSVDVIFFVGVTPEGRFTHLDVNRAFVTGSGIKPESLIGHYIDEISDIAFRKTLLDKYSTCLHAGHQIDYIAQYSFGQKSITYHSTLSPIRDASGRIHRIVGVARDITQLKEQELALLAKEQEYRMVIENAPDYVARFDSEGRLFYTNPHLAALLESIGKMAMHRTPAEVSATGNLDALEKVIRRVLNSGKTEKITLSYPTAQGAIVHQEILCAPERSLRGKVIGVMAFGRDVSERIALDEALATKERQARALIENIPDNIVRYDTACRTIYVSPLMERVFGEGELERFLGKTPSEINPEYQAYEASIREVVATGEKRELKMRLEGPEGELQHHLVRFIPERDGQGELVSVLAIGMDVTKSVQLKEEIRKALNFTTEVIQAIPDLLFEMSAEGVYLNVWAQNEELLVAQKAHLLGKNMREVLSAESVEAALRTMREVDSEGHSLGNLYRIEYPEGTYWFELSASMRKSSGTYIMLSRDITVRKQAEEALAIREMEFRSLAENTPDNIARWDAEGRYLYINPIHERVLGKSLSEVIGTFISDSHEGVKAAIAQVVATKEKVTVLQTVPNEAGEMEFHEVTIVPEFDSEGRFVTILGIGRDMSERYKQERLLRESEARLQNIIENEPECIKIIDAEGKLVYMNPAGLDMLEATLEQVSGKEVLGVIVEKYREPFAQMHQRVIAGEKAHLAFETVGLRGKHSWLETTSVPIEMDGKTVLLGVTRDITQRKKAEDVLSEREREFRSLAENTPDNIARWDAEGRYLYINPIHERVLGKSLSEVIGTFISDSHEGVKAAIAQVVATKEKVTVLQTVLNEAGEMEFHEVTIVPEFDSEGRFVTILGIGRDMSERYKQERLLRESEARFRHFFERQVVGMAITSPTKGWMQTNEKLHEMLGYTHEELTQLTWVAMTYPDDILLDEEQFERLLAGEIDDYMLEKRFIRKNNTLIHTKIAISCVRHQDKTIDYVLALIEDISERKIQELKLQRTKTKLSTVISTIPDLVWVKDAEGVFLLCNPAFERFFGAPESEILGKTDYDFVSKEQADFFRQKDRVAIEAGEISINEEEIVFADTGQRAILETRKVAVYDDDVFMGVLGIGRDVTLQKEHEQQLAIKEREFRTLAENSPDTIARYDSECRCIYANPAQMTTMGLSPEEVLGFKPTAYIESDSALAYEKVIRAVFATGEERQVEYEWPNKKGHKIVSQMRILPEHDTDEQIKSVLVIGRDITQLHKTTQKLQESQKHLSEAQRIAKIGSWELEFPGLKLTWSHDIYTILEIPSELFEPSYDHFLNIVHPDDRTMVDEAFAHALANQTPYDIVHRLLLPNERIKYVHQRGESYCDLSGELVSSFGTLQDITHQKTVEKKIEYLAHHDALTGLPNRLLTRKRTQEAITQATQRGTQAALLFIDLDGFKIINDSMGHTAGDSMLKMVATRLAEAIRPFDTVGREGGDEFLLLMGQIDTPDDAIAAAQRILESFEQTFIIGGQSLSISASIGIALFPMHGENFETLLQNSDTAMYKAKELGKNTYCLYTQQMSHHLKGQLRLQNDLKWALHRGEFFLHYQPQVVLSSRSIIGAEALLRWNHPQLGIISPAEFIPLAEATGMIAAIGEWVINEACEQAARWHRQNIPVIIAVNISAVQFKRGNLEKIIKDALHHTKLPAHFLELELTESILVSDTDNALRTLRALKEIGVKLSIDDFGTGYSSLSYLKRFAVDKLKIDQSFVRDILRDPEDAVIVRTIIQMAKNLNLRCVAEGVENLEVLHVIEELGCEEVQGYHFAKPMAESEFESYYQHFSLVRER